MRINHISDSEKSIALDNVLVSTPTPSQTVCNVSYLVYDDGTSHWEFFAQWVMLWNWNH